MTEGVPPDPFCYPVPVSPHFECDDEAPVRDNGTIVLHEVIEWRDCLELRLPDLDIDRASYCCTEQTDIKTEVSRYSVWA